MIKGLYPGNLISTNTNKGTSTTCLLGGYEALACIQDSMLRGPYDSSNAWVKGDLMFKLKQEDRLSEICKVAYEHKEEVKCLIPKDGSGYVSSLSSRHWMTVVNNIVKRSTYLRLDIPEKNMFTVIKNNKDTEYLIECPETCK